MSTLPADGPPLGERRKSLGKYVKRMSSVFKREKSSKPMSGAAAAPVASASEQQQSKAKDPQREVVQNEAATAAATATTTQAFTQDSTETSAATYVADPSYLSLKADSLCSPVADLLTPTTSIQAPAPALAPASSTPALDRNAMQRERARALFARYGLTLEPQDWVVSSAPAPLVPRVEKPIRMRVHRSCHRCGTLYGHDKVCVQCEHKRCKQCPRYPKKKTAGEKGKTAEAADQPKKKKLLTVTTRHGNDLAYQPAKQRVRRSCHKCDAFFVPPTASTCESCSHVRCTKCPREPAKRNKWPSGYPGDAAADSDEDEQLEQEKSFEQFRRIWRKPRRIVRWECEQCHGLFRQGSHLCPGCGHERCDQCSRSP